LGDPEMDAPANDGGNSRFALAQASIPGLIQEMESLGMYICVYMCIFLYVYI
jgi:hypothetical protein